MLVGRRDLHSGACKFSGVTVFLVGVVVLPIRHRSVRVVLRAWVAAGVVRLTLMLMRVTSNRSTLGTIAAVLSDQWRSMWSLDGRSDW